VREFHSVDVIGNRTRLLGNRDYLILRDVDKLCIGIDEAPDQSGAGDSIYLRVFSRHPLARGRPDVTACGQSLLSPIRNAAFQEVRLDPHKAQCSGHALADFAYMNAVGDDLAPTRQISSPLLDSIRRAMKRIGHKRSGADKIGLASNINDDRRSVRA
jgi:hypothetical protein